MNWTCTLFDGISWKAYKYLFIYLNCRLLLFFCQFYNYLNVLFSDFNSLFFIRKLRFQKILPWSRAWLQTVSILTVNSNELATIKQMFLYLIGRNVISLRFLDISSLKQTQSYFLIYNWLHTNPIKFYDISFAETTLIKFPVFSLVGTNFFRFPDFSLNELKSNQISWYLIGKKNNQIFWYLIGWTQTQSDFLISHWLYTTTIRFPDISLVEQKSNQIFWYLIG